MWTKQFLTVPQFGHVVQSRFHSTTHFRTSYVIADVITDVYLTMFSFLFYVIIMFDYIIALDFNDMRIDFGLPSVLCKL